ncbi:MAG: hypothetical protein VB071_01715 [Lawsonibacter sp.]|nr:hypothetical protein [Lawsonibacter sp.]
MKLVGAEQPIHDTRGKATGRLRYAAALVKVEYQELPYAITFDETLAGKNCLEGESPVWDTCTLTVGDPQPDESEGIKVTVLNELSRLHHAAMETAMALLQPVKKVRWTFSTG